MIVNHFNTFPYGGAATAAMRFHHEMLRQGLKSRFLYHLSDRDAPGSTTFKRIEFREETNNSWTSALRKMSTRRRNRRIFHLYDQHLATRDAELEVFSMAELPRKTRLDWQRIRANIVHLHWIAFFADYPSFFDSIPDDVPIVWTLHDMNPLTGGCHYSSRCTRFKSGCGSCPQIINAGPNDVSSINFRAKRRAINRKNITVVTPSKWLGGLAAGSRIWPTGTRFEVIRYGLDLQAFHPIDKPKAREQLGLPNESVLIGFGAEDTGNRRKGFDLLEQALVKLDCDSNVQCVILGSGALPEKIQNGTRIHRLGYVDCQKQITQFYSACDLVVVPSREDNSPQIGLEAMACGTPVVGFDVGGISEYVIPGQTGQLATAENVHELAQSISMLVDDSGRRAKYGLLARQLMEQAFEISNQTEKYCKLYRDLTKSFDSRNVA